MAAFCVAGLKIVLSRNATERFTLTLDHLQAEAGDRIALVGRSGSGKSTLIEFLALLVRPAELDRYDIKLNQQCANLGPRLLDGQFDDLASMRARQIGYVPQNGGLLPFISARENALASLRASGFAMDDVVLSNLQGMAERLGISNDLHKRRALLSGGERKRVALLRALVSPRSLILADEPTSGLDDATADQAITVLCETAERHGTICIASMHDTDRARAAGFRMVKVVPNETGETSYVETT